MLIDEREFCNTMRKTFGFTGSMKLLREIFQALDLDASGQIGFEEVCLATGLAYQLPLFTH